jgi:hypothetical protein
MRRRAMIQVKHEENAHYEMVHVSSSKGSVGVNLSQNQNQPEKSDTALVVLDVEKVEVRLHSVRSGNVQYVWVKARNHHGAEVTLILEGVDVLEKLKNEVCYTEMDVLLESS